MSLWAVATVRVGPALSILAAQPGNLVGTSSEPHADGTLYLSGVPLQTSRVALGIASTLPPSHLAISYQVELVPSFADLMRIWIWHNQAVVLALWASSSMAVAAPRLSQSLTSASTAWRKRDLGPDSILASHELDSLGQAWTSVRLFAGWDVVT